MSDRILHALKNKIKEYKSQMGEQMVLGHAKTFDEYKFLQGKYQGVVFMEEEIHELEKKMLESE